MAKLLATVKAIITRLVFSVHSLIGIWQVTIFKKNPFYWYLSSPILLLFFEGIFTLTIKENQEWKWFCPSVFLYLASIVPAIWLLELDKVDRRLRIKEETFNLTASAGDNFKELNNLIGVQIKLPELALSTETWITLIEQFLMLILIIGRWMLPKGDLTRDQLSQLLLVYIGTAADIIEFFDSFKDDKIASEPILVLLTLGIWSWSLMQFTVVLTATKSRKSRLTTAGNSFKESNNCCTIDVWGIAINITLQDAPFLVFRLLLITHFKIISYMNVFFTCKNTLVILLQLYRLYVVHSEHRKKMLKKERMELSNISIISRGDMYDLKKKRTSRAKKQEEESGDSDDLEKRGIERKRKTKSNRKDTGYSTGSSHSSNHHRQKYSVKQQPDFKSISEKHSSRSKASDSKERKKLKNQMTLSEESETELSLPNTPVKKSNSKSSEKKFSRKTTKSLSSSRSSSE
ncbi:transmembrane protein 26 [Coccinella septempunctata]|uniref:transmembrane protein 26 n=1 Tax=Coccinella septempunctata TaxID=41139 RepID=UPI001D097106|nr:transmembrane protein 26 [Coccinella septempunctata]